MKRRIKKLLSVVCVLTLTLSMVSPAFAYASHEITEDELLAAIADGTATVTMESRTLNSYTDEEIEASPNLQMLFSNIGCIPYSEETFRDNGEVYTATVQSGSDEIEFLLYPYALLSLVDVGTAGSATISTTLKMLSSVSVNGEYEDWDNYIRIGNIEAAMGCGDNTVFVGPTSAAGKAPEGLSISGLTSALSALLGLATAETALTTISGILGAIGSISYTNNNYVNSADIDSSTARAVGAKWHSKLMVWDADHEVKLYSFLATKKSALTANKQTYGVAQWTFDVYFGTATGPKYTDVTLEPTGTYLVNVK